MRGSEDILGSIRAYVKQHTCKSTFGSTQIDAEELRRTLLSSEQKLCSQRVLLERLS